MPHTLLIASAHQRQRQYLATQFDADGHDIYEADGTSTTAAKLSDPMAVRPVSDKGPAARASSAWA
jgi:hypothetical protein